MSVQNRVSNAPLPLEVTSKILNMLSFQEKLNARLVCNYWLTILDGFEKYKFRLILKDNTLVDFLLNSFTDLEFVQLDGVSQPISTTFSRNKYPRIRRVFLGNQNSGPTVLSFLKYGLVSAEELKIEAYAFLNVRTSQISSVLREVRWENLTKFEIRIITVIRNPKKKLSKTQVTLMSCFLKSAHIPNLKEFIVYLNHNSNFGDRGSLIETFGSNLYEFIARHSKTLKILSWSLPTEKPGRLLVPQIPNEIKETMGSRLKLKTIKMMIQSHQNIFGLVMPSLCGSDSLTSFQLNMVEFSNLHRHAQLAPEFFGQIDQILQRNKDTLTDIYIDVPAVLDMNLLRSCHKLKSLSIYITNPETTLIDPPGKTAYFPELKSFHLFAWGVRFESDSDLSFDSWIVERMPMLEKMKFTTYERFLSIPVLQTLVGGLNRLKEIRIDVDGMMGHLTGKLDIYCAGTEGLTFRNIDNPYRGVTGCLSFVIEIDR